MILVCKLTEETEKHPENLRDDSLKFLSQKRFEKRWYRLHNKTNKKAGEDLESILDATKKTLDMKTINKI